MVKNQFEMIRPHKCHICSSDIKTRNAYISVYLVQISFSLGKELTLMNCETNYERQPLRSNVSNNYYTLKYSYEIQYFDIMPWPYKHGIGIDHITRI